MSEKPKMKLPEIAADDTWTWTVQGATYRFREEKLRERSQAANEARTIAPSMPDYDEQARVLAMVVQRRKQDGTFEPVTYGEIMGKGRRLFEALSSAYLMGLAALEKKQVGFLETSKEETTAIQKSEESVRP